MENLKRKLSGYVKLPEEEIEKMASRYKQKDLEKNEILIQPGNFVKNWYFVDKGCLVFFIP